MVLAGAKRQLNEKGPRLRVLGLFYGSDVLLTKHLGRSACPRKGGLARSYLIRKVKGEITSKHLIGAIQSRTDLCVRVRIKWVRY